MIITKCIYDGGIAQLIDNMETLLWELDNKIKAYKNRYPEENKLYICETIAAKFVHNNFKEENEND